MIKNLKKEFLNMNKTKISAEIVADSIDPRGNRLTSVLVVMPRIIIAEINTHRMLSKNTSSSRAIPLKKMVEAIKNDPFIPIAWQKEHTGMQGNEYIIDEGQIRLCNNNWLNARDNAVSNAHLLSIKGATKQLCNRLLEPFMWTTMLITGSKEGWENFFSLRCPNYDGFKSKKEASKEFLEKGNINTSTWSELDWLNLNKGQAEIHIMDLAEKIYDAVNESTPKQLESGQWHIPFEDKIKIDDFLIKDDFDNIDLFNQALEPIKVKVSVAMAARTSYTVVGEEKEIDYQKMIDLHDKLIAYDPPHSSPLEHCARAMSEVEYTASKSTGYTRKGVDQYGWCNNLKGFIPYRYFIDNKIEL